jgi:hypothetical protein
MLAAVCRELFPFEPILMVRYRWPHSQASEDALMGAWTWPYKPGPPETPLMGCMGRSLNSIHLDFAAIMLAAATLLRQNTKLKYFS